MKRRLYFDHNATSPQRPEARKARLAALEFGNPSSIHWAGRPAREQLDLARDQVAAQLGRRSSEMVFTSGGSEANALALWGAYLGRRDLARTRILVSAIEHPSVLSTAKELRRLGATVDLLPVKTNGQLDLTKAQEALSPDVALVALMVANNETGVLQPVAELARLAHDVGALMHCDAVQAAGRMAFPTDLWGVDLLSLAGHKFGAGLGIGLLFVRDGVPLVPLAAGHQEGGRRSGTEDVGACTAFASTLAAVEAERDPAQSRIASFRDRLEVGALKLPGSEIVGVDAERLGNTSNICFHGASGEALVIALDLAGVAVSSGAACASGTLEPSHVLLAMGRSAAEARASVRFSLGPETEAADVDELLTLLPALVDAVRRSER